MTIPKATITEDLTPQVNGFTSTFTTGQSFIPGSLCVEFNGQRLRKGSGHDFVEVGLDGFEMDLVPELGEHVTVQYEIEDTGAGYPLVVAYPSDPEF
jgi:hypothetical protein